MQRKTLYRFEQIVGTTFAYGMKPGEPLTVEVEIYSSRGMFTTTTHEDVEEYVGLSVVGYTPTMGGQIERLLVKQPIEPAEGWSSAKLNQLAAIWRRWHLNTLRAGCVHQYVPEGMEGVAGLDVVEPCKETGYKYGHAWLYEPLPETVIQEIVEMFTPPTQDAPEVEDGGQPEVEVESK